MNVGIAMPARFVFVHNAGKDYRHYFEVTWFGIPIMKVNERYIDGKSLFELPFATYDNDASTNQGANLAVWPGSLVPVNLGHRPHRAVGRRLTTARP